MSKAGPILPVTIVTDRTRRGGQAWRARGVTSPAADPPVLGGAAIPVMVLAAGDLAENGGGYTVVGDVELLVTAPDELVIWQFGAAGDPGAAFWLARYNSGIGRRP